MSGLVGVLTVDGVREEGMRFIRPVLRVWNVSAAGKRRGEC